MHRMPEPLQLQTRVSELSWRERTILRSSIQPAERRYELRAVTAWSNKEGATVKQSSTLERVVAQDAQENLVNRPLPAFHARVEGSVATYEWSKAADREQACRLLEAHASGDPDGPQAPLLIKGAINQWPAINLWSLDFLAKNYGRQRVAVRVSPSMQFPYCEPRLLPWWRRFHPGRLPPTELLYMSLEEFAERMQEGCSLQPLVYPEEFYYMQSMFAAPMFQHIDLFAPPLSCLGLPGIPGDGGKEPSGLPVAQVPRIWMSPGGAISPLHYDTASSFLMQIRGRKRLVFWPPVDLKALKPYSSWHILRRRAKVKPTDTSFPAKLIGTEAVLEPGDVLWFPGLWSHHTESQEFSLSMTYRFSTAHLQPPKKMFFCF